MELLQRIKLYLDISENSKDTILDEFINIAKDYAVQYCHLETYDDKLDSIIVKMVVEDYNRRKAEGISSRNYSGISESYGTDYSPQTLSLLNKYRRIRVI